VSTIVIKVGCKNKSVEILFLCMDANPPSPLSKSDLHSSLVFLSPASSPDGLGEVVRKVGDTFSTPEMLEWQERTIQCKNRNVVCDRI
jgi:hypothetical protein